MSFRVIKRVWVSVCLLSLVSSLVWANPARQKPRQTQRMLYTGIEGAMPRSVHMTWLQYKAQQQRQLEFVKDKNNNPAYQMSKRGGAPLQDSAAVLGDCMVAIGNDFIPGNTQPINKKDNVVIIDGDVINAGRCN